MKKAFFLWRECQAALRKSSTNGRHCRSMTNSKILEFQEKIMSVCIKVRLKVNRVRESL